MTDFEMVQKMKWRDWRCEMRVYLLPIKATILGIACTEMLYILTHNHRPGHDDVSNFWAMYIYVAPLLKTALAKH